MTYSKNILMSERFFLNISEIKLLKENCKDAYI